MSDNARVNEALNHLLNLSDAARDVLVAFGDEYEGRLSALREASEAYEAWLQADAVPCMSAERKGEP